MRKRVRLEILSIYNIRAAIAFDLHKQILKNKAEKIDTRRVEDY